MHIYSHSVLFQSTEISNHHCCFFCVSEAQGRQVRLARHPPSAWSPFRPFRWPWGEPWKPNRTRWYRELLGFIISHRTHVYNIKGVYWWDLAPWILWLCEWELSWVGNALVFLWKFVNVGGVTSILAGLLGITKNYMHIEANIIS